MIVNIEYITIVAERQKTPEGLLRTNICLSGVSLSHKFLSG